MIVAGGTRARLLLVALLALLLTLVPAGSALAEPHGSPTARDPYADLDETRAQLQVVQSQADQLAADHRAAEADLAALEDSLAATVSQREQAELVVAEGTDAVDELRAEAEEALAAFLTTTGRLERLQTHGADTAGEKASTDEDSGDPDLAALTLDDVLAPGHPGGDGDAANPDGEPATNHPVVEALSALAARHDPDSDPRPTSPHQEFAHTQAEQAARLLELRTAHQQAVERAEAAGNELAALEDEEAARVAAVREASDLVAMLDAVVAYNDLSQAELEYQVADLSATIASLRSVQPRAGVPPELAHYGNGRVPADALVEIGIGAHRLWAPAANAFTSLRAAAAADGIAIGVTDSYRSYAAQVDLVRRKGLYAEGGLAARPGHSDHGWGLALDLVLDAEALAWMRANAHNYGFVETTPREPWHWVFTAQPRR